MHGGVSPMYIDRMQRLQQGQVMDKTYPSYLEKGDARSWSRTVLSMSSDEVPRYLEAKLFPEFPNSHAPHDTIPRQPVQLDAIAAVVGKKLMGLTLTAQQETMVTETMNPYYSPVWFRGPTHTHTYTYAG